MDAVFDANNGLSFEMAFCEYVVELSNSLGTSDLHSSSEDRKTFAAFRLHCRYLFF